MEDYYEYLDSNGVTTLYKLIKDDTVALIDSYSVTVNGITTTLDTHINDRDIHTPISDIESMVDTKIAGLVNSAPETLDTLKELSDALGNDPNFATTVANQIGNKANSVHTHVVSDITDFPTIPTKLSQLENDMGFGTGGGITSISWTNITDKPTIPTKTSDLTNDSGFAIDSNVVHKTGDETIDGTKTFSSKIVGNLQGNADTATKASYLDNYSLPGGNKIYLDWDKQVDNHVGLKVDNTTMGGLITTKNIGAHSAGNGIDSSGSNYVKFKDGTQICWGTNKDGEKTTFAKAFKSTPGIVFGYNTGADFSEIIHGQARYSSSTSFTMQVWNFNKNKWEGRSVEWIAIGRWK